MRMTDAGIRNLKRKAQRFEVWEDGRTGFGLRVSPTGRKVFQFMYWRDDKARRMTLGVYGQVSLAEARVKFAEAKKALEHGGDPAAKVVQQRRADRAAETVTELAEDYLRKWARPRKRSAAEDERILRKDVLPRWGKRKAKDIVRREVIALLDEIVARGSPIAANRTLACVRRMYSWALERDLLGASPCVGIKAPAPEARRDRALSNDEIATFWHGLGDTRMIETIRLALKLQLATAQRRGEVIGAEWSEFDRENGVWTIPAHKAKNNELHVVPLSPLALSLLDAIKDNAGNSPFLFPSHIANKPITPDSVSHALRKNLKPIGVDNVRPHDLRRTAATAMAALGVDRTVLARVLNHVDRSVTGRYDAHSYLNEKRAALGRWGHKLQEIITGEPASVDVNNVVVLHDR